MNTLKASYNHKMIKEIGAAEFQLNVNGKLELLPHIHANLHQTVGHGKRIHLSILFLVHVTLLSLKIISWIKLIIFSAKIHRRSDQMNSLPYQNYSFSSQNMQNLFSAEREKILSKLQFCCQLNRGPTTHTEMHFNWDIDGNSILSLLFGFRNDH